MDTNLNRVRIDDELTGQIGGGRIFYRSIVGQTPYLYSSLDKEKKFKYSFDLNNMNAIDVIVKNECAGWKDEDTIKRLLDEGLVKPYVG